MSPHRVFLARAAIAIAGAASAALMIVAAPACSSSPTVLGPPAATDDSGTTCPANVASLAYPMWKSPLMNTAGSCSATDIAAFRAAVDDPNAAYSDLYGAVSSDVCKSCIFSSIGDASWQLVVWDPDRASGNAFANFGACYAIASGSDACGKATEDDNLCLAAACPDTCSDKTSCLLTADGDGCKAKADSVHSGCGAALQELSAQCLKLKDAVDVVCGAGPKSLDGGTSGDAGDGG